MPNPDLRLLALDGGGVRGLSALMILQQLMDAVNPDAPPKPCDYFGMIGGTSTGGLIAIMLGRLKMSIDECIDAYLQLSDRIFQKNGHRATVKGKIQGRFDSDELERAVKEVIKGQRLQEDALLKDSPDASCKVFVCATSKETSDTVCLTSYKSPRGNNDLLNSVKIWEACRATSAASSFDPIAIGRYNEEFVDGATGANNPVVELWNQAQLMWGPDPLEGKVKCLVSIGTGILSLKPFRDDLLHIGKTLIAIATETEQTAERFRQDKTYLDSSNRYFRFNVIRGLEDIGLEESTKRKEIAAATRRYVASQDVYKQMQACASNLASREYVGEYRTNFSLEGIPRVKTFVERPSEMAELERALLPQRRRNMRQKIFVLYGLGGIVKTQLAVEFTRRHHRKFSLVFWLNGSSEVSLKLSIARCAGRIPASQTSDASRTYSTSSAGNIDEVVGEVKGWLAQPDNTEWLVVFDNVDRDYSAHTVDPLAYDVRQYFSGADHGSVLITTRLARLEQLGGSQQVNKVDRAQAQEILESWYRKELVTFGGSGRLFSLLDGLPLAIAQAGAYLQQSGVDLSTYLRFYEQQWEELMQTRDQADAPLQDYPNRSVWTTWTISSNVIREQDKATSNLLLLWSFLDNKDLWFRLFTAACSGSRKVAAEVSRWIGDLANSELKFTQSMQLLRSYSLVESVENGASYATHPVVHRWARYYCGQDYSDELARLALAIVGWAVPDSSMRDYSVLQRRLLPHAQACSQRILEKHGYHNRSGQECSRTEEREVVLHAMHLVGILYADQGKLGEAEKMYMRALQGKEEALGPNHTSTLDTVNNLGLLYTNQGKLGEAEKMYMRSLQGYEEALGPDHTSTLDTVNNLGILYVNQSKLAEAEKMYIRALQGYEKALGMENVDRYIPALNTMWGFGNLFQAQKELVQAKQMFQRALTGFQVVIGTSCAQSQQLEHALSSLDASNSKSWALVGRIKR
ncbi:FabD/lysophospholipase-like protein [Lentithecium fluviatile CBS 122367]|uniref:FabD/lysophospholipase-like protein n=1 Tax=Lentithecium fluviatile CBS 122367 TaxID=1168545 RepID=A0A6G1IJS5_9PLEO|nr:FabD/lysophospholipase-like protein [Lentithecium fluviatile CBS 122367]